MTEDQKTELEYLINLLSEATRWQVDPGDDALRLEVNSRIERILHGEEAEEADEAQEEPDPEAMDAYIKDRRRRDREARTRYKQGKTRVMVDGKMVWKPLSECRKVKRWPNKPDSSGWKWEWIGPQEATND